MLSPSSGQVTNALLTRSPLRNSQYEYQESFVRLACIRHAASVHPEPGSNSPQNSSHYCGFASSPFFWQVPHFLSLFNCQGSSLERSTRCPDYPETNFADTRSRRHRLQTCRTVSFTRPGICCSWLSVSLVIGLPSGETLCSRVARTKAYYMQMGLFVKGIRKVWLRANSADAFWHCRPPLRGYTGTGTSRCCGKRQLKPIATAFRVGEGNAFAYPIAQPAQAGFAMDAATFAQHPREGASRRSNLLPTGKGIATAAFSPATVVTWAALWGIATPPGFTLSLSKWRLAMTPRQVRAEQLHLPVEPSADYAD